MLPEDAHLLRGTKRVGEGTNVKGLKTSYKARLVLLYLDSALSCWPCCDQTRDLCVYAFMILNMTHWKDKSLVIIGNKLPSF